VLKTYWTKLVGALENVISWRVEIGQDAGIW